jgi:hypothetical protein
MASKAGIMALPQTTIELDGETYLVDAMPATVSLEVQQELMKTGGVPSVELIKRIIIGSVSYKNKNIDKNSFDIIFARRTTHLYELTNQIIQWNMPDLFTESGTDE